MIDFIEKNKLNKQDYGFRLLNSEIGNDLNSSKQKMDKMSLFSSP